MILTGVLINAAAVAAGGVLGTLGGRLMPEKMRQTVLGATALVSMGIGISGAIGSSNQLIPILSLVIGAVIGELCHNRENIPKAILVGFGSFLSFIVGTGLKLIAAVGMFLHIAADTYPVARDWFVSLF